MPQLRVKIIFTYKIILDMYDCGQPFVHLLHYVRLDEYYLYRFEKFIIRKLFCSCCFEQQITDIIFKIPFTLAESQHSIIEKRTVKLAASVLSCQLWAGKCNWQSIKNARGQTATEDVPKKFPAIAIPQLVVVKSAFKSLKNNRDGAYYL